MLSSSRTSRYSHRSNSLGLSERQWTHKHPPNHFRKLIVNRGNKNDRRLQTDPNAPIPKLNNSRISQKIKQSASNLLSSKRSSRLASKQDTNQLRRYVNQMKILNKKVPNPQQKCIQLDNDEQNMVKSYIRQSPLPVSHTSNPKDRQVHSSMSNFSHQLTTFQRLKRIEEEVEQLIQRKLNSLSNRKLPEPISYTAEVVTKRNSIPGQELFNDSKIIKQIKSHYSLNTKRMNSVATSHWEQVETIQRIIREIQKVKESEQNNEQVIGFLDKKIEMLEKIMAQNFLESQLMKKYYFARLTQKKSKLASSRRKTVGNEPSFLMTPPSILNNHKKLKHDTSNKASYKAPSEEAYDIYRFKHLPFKSNAQPLPRSSYHRDYLKYSNLKTSESCKKSDHQFIPSRDHYKKSSIYSHDYKGLKTTSVDYKQLDSYRDKLKDINVSYIPLKNIQELQKEINKKNIQTMKIRKELFKSRIKVRGSVASPLGNPAQSSQNHREFAGLKGKPGCIKDKVLNHLKYSYRNISHV